MKHKWVLLSASATLFLFLGVNAYAGDTRGRTVGGEPTVPFEQRVLYCIEIGTDVWECRRCYESEASMQSYCSSQSWTISVEDYPP